MLLTQAGYGTNEPMWKKVRVTAEGEGFTTLGTDVDDGHQVITDEPKKIGGRGSGASPLHTLLVALAGCEQGIICSPSFSLRQLIFD